jgi:DNA-binding XRE family transcriptional regulator
MPSKVPIPREAHPVIRAFRDELGLTYAQVARVLGVSPTRVKQIVNGYESYRKADGSWSVRKKEGE